VSLLPLDRTRLETKLEKKKTEHAEYDKKERKNEGGLKKTAPAKTLRGGEQGGHRGTSGNKNPRACNPAEVDA